MKIYGSFADAVDAARKRLLDTGMWVAGDQWQSIDVANKPEMVTREILDFDFKVGVAGESLPALRKDIRPNLPWADNHFMERVGGAPLNPGEEWARWPWGNSADKFRNLPGGKFSHTYMERFWPKFADWTNGGKLGDNDEIPPEARSGIRYAYGDLNDVINHLSNHPLSRQAYLPIWFPEDTGIAHGARVPCTLGYHWIMREGYLHMVYDIRSCDIVRHFQDDIYLAVRLMLWVLDRLRERNAVWKKVHPGMFTMHVHSLHMFKNDMRTFVKDGKWINENV